MIALLALLLASPMPQPRAREWATEILCWPSGYCCPRVVNLGAWDPIPQDYMPAKYTGPAPEVDK